MSKKYKLLILSIALVAIVVALLGTSYAYFTSEVTGNDTATPTVITAGNLAVTFSDGLEVSKSDMVPGESIIKTFSVENTGTGELKYDIYFSEICNLFVNNNDLVYTLTSTNNGYSVSTPIPAPTTPSKLVDSQTIAAGVTQEYILTITFVNADYDQSNEMGAYFSTKLNINDYKGALHCSKYNNTVKYYVNNEEVQDIPNNIGYLYSTSNCTNNAIITWDNTNWNYAVDYDNSTADSVCSIYFNLEEYTITYNLDGGTNNSSNPSSYTIETDTITLSNPTKEGYAFNGWTGDNPTITKGSTGNKTYTATWIDKCASVTYQDGTTCSVTYSQQTGTYNRLAYSSVDSSYRCPAYDQSSGGSSCSGATDACTSTTCTLSNCGSYVGCSATYTHETGTQTRTCTQTCKSTLNSSITCSTNTNYQDSNSTSCTGTVAKTVTLTLNPNGGTYNGTTANSTKTMTYGKTNNNSIGKATRSGYTFYGWSTTATGGRQLYDSTGKNVKSYYYWTAAYSTGTWKYTSESNLTLYARWTPWAYQNSYACKDSNGSISSSDCSLYCSVLFGYTQGSCTSSSTVAPTSADQTSGKYCWCK